MKRSSTFFFTAAALLFILAVLKYFDSSNGEEKAIEKGWELNGSVAGNFDTVFVTAEDKVASLVAELGEGSMVPEDLSYILDLAIGDDANAREVIIAFEPFQFDSDLELFGRLFVVADGQWTGVPIAYDYRDTLETKADWYTISRFYQTTVWSAPYLSETEEVLIELNVPIYWQEGGAGNNFIGAVKYVIELNDVISRTVKQSDKERAVLSFCDEYGQNVFDEGVRSKFDLGSVVPDLEALDDEQQEVFKSNPQDWLLINSTDDLSNKHLFYTTSKVQNWRYMISFDAKAWQKLQAGVLVKYLYLFTALIMLVVGIIARMKEGKTNRMQIHKNDS